MRASLLFPALFAGGLAASICAAAPDDTEKSINAFREVKRVLLSPRCVNCHPKGDSPLQGDLGRPHNMLVQRGADGHGVTTMRCDACHQTTNSREPHGPPGAPEWHLPPEQTPMVFEGKSDAELCVQLKDKSQNGGKSLAQLVEHAEVPLVKWGWNPGSGRTVPPISHEEFVKYTKTWIALGAHCPQ
jgi:hypothetical protein